MKLCEKCGKEHNGTYGSGRFCSSKCSHSYSAIVNNEVRIKNINIASKLSIQNGTHNVFSGNANIVEGMWEDELKDIGFDVKRRFPISNPDIKNSNHFYRMDMLINDKVDLEIDGSTFHIGREDKEKTRDTYIQSLGYIVYRVPYINPKRRYNDFKKQINDFVDWYNENIKNAE